MKALFSHAVACFGILSGCVVAAPAAEPYAVISLPSAGLCDESSIPSSAFADKGKVFVRLDNVRPGLLSVGVCDAGNNDVVCALAQGDNAAETIPANIKCSFSGELCFYELQHSVQTPGSYWVRVEAADAGTPVSQDVELRVGMLKEDASHAAGPVLIAAAVIILSLLVFLIIYRAMNPSLNAGEYILRLPHGAFRISPECLPPGARLTLGSAASCRLRLNDAHVSACHGTLSLVSGQLVYTDSGSAAGSFINRNRIPAHRPMVLPRGCVLQLGSRVRIRIR